MPRPLTQAEARLVEVGNRFTFSLFRETLAHEPAGANVFVSPLSVAMALGMTYNGAAGANEAEMQTALQLDGLTRDDINAGFRGLIDLLRALDGRATFTVANSIWYRNTFPVLPAFLETNRASFDAEIGPLDFAAPQAPATINGWVNERTAGRITEIVPNPLPADAMMYLVNAIYFKATWTSQFDPALTSPRPFQLTGGGSASVPTMQHRGPVPLAVAYDAAVTVLDLPYGGGAFSMTILLPHPAVPLDTVIHRLTSDAWTAWIAALHEGEASVFLPRFTQRYDLGPVKDVLAVLGMPGAFCPAAPDFSRMTSEAVCISEVKHKTFVLVDEEGTEAAAATSVGIGLVSAPPAIFVDRPFVYVIRERFSGTILFIGRMMNPAA